jgi:hypothetical protein
VIKIKDLPCIEFFGAGQVFFFIPQSRSPLLRQRPDGF